MIAQDKDDDAAGFDLTLFLLLFVGLAAGLGYLMLSIDPNDV